jgi:hypothetical protein
MINVKSLKNEFLRGLKDSDECYKFYGISEKDPSLEELKILESLKKEQRIKGDEMIKNLKKRIDKDKEDIYDIYSDRKYIIGYRNPYKNNYEIFILWITFLSCVYVLYK